MAAKKKRQDAPAGEVELAKFKGIVGGKVVIKRLDSVQANDWNPNRMTEFQFKSLIKGLQDDGWLISDSMLVWGKDASGKRRDIIINGEHRWKAATELGMITGPMVFLDGLSERDAKKLTIKLDNKRGQFDDDALGALIREIAVEDDPLLGIDLGFDDKTFAAILSNGSVSAPAGGDSAYKEQYGVIVMCKNEKHQKETYDGLLAQGLDCRVVVT